MKNLIYATTLICLTTAGPLSAQDGVAPNIKARPIQITSCAEIPSSIGFGLKPMGFEPGFKIYYLLEGQDIVAIKDDSLKVDYIKTVKGKDISKHRNGKAAYEQGTFPKVSEDGKYGIFSIEVEQNQFKQVESLSLKGSITLMTGSDSKEAKAEISASDSKTHKAGPFSVKINKSSDSSMGFGGGDKDSIGLSIKGPLDGIIEIKLMESEKELESNGTMSINGKKTFYFAKPSSGKASLSIRYWGDTKEHKINFEM